MHLYCCFCVVREEFLACLLDYIWGQVVYMASLWAMVAEAFKGILIIEAQLNWDNL